MGIQINGQTDTVASTISGGSVTLTSAALPSVSNISATRVNVTGVSTFTSGPVLIGSGTSTGTASQTLQVTGGGYISGNLGIGTLNATRKLDVVGDVRVTGILTAAQYNITTHVPIQNVTFNTVTSNGTVSGSFTISVKSNCLFSFNGTAYKSSGNIINMTLSINGIGNLTTISYYTNELSSHKSSPTGYALATLNPGTYTVVITCDSSTDNNDRGNCSVLAIPTL
jgi:hypothetical protein